MGRQRKIIHVDMDCFYAAIEERDHPQWRGRPLAVGGSSDRRGVLCTANYPARQYGVRSAMPTGHAMRLCPQLLVVPTRFGVYKEESQAIFQIFRQFTDLIQPLSLDEAFLDVSECDAFHGSATLMAQEIRRQIYELRQLTASAGVAPNKFLAKEVVGQVKGAGGGFLQS